ncbi:peptidoglycan DD-metalloendopeptidase family protein [Roseateles chitinivorans]|uniref:peptidoglycan DD-metalloendopeptidase family protein n=1 Tax=Roseateles chitinivorans TaxID=2917965 RepID=UPI003D677853
MQPLFRSPLLWVSVAVLALTGCQNTPHRAPVEDRPVGKGAPAVIPGTAVTPAPESKPLPGAENAGKPGYYTVKPGDTLIRIAMDNGQGWREVARWNGMDNPNLVEVGQVLRVVPPGLDPGAVTTKPLVTSKVETRPLDGKSPAPATTTAAASAPASATAAPSVPLAAKDDDDISWGWPASGAVAAGFDEVRNKGMAFSGKAGDPVFAAADGRVMYAGAGLRGYGNMIIIKHSTNYLTAYAHNQTLLVKEDQVVRKGQKIAEMGSSDADSVKLHFEVRKQGKPIDPSKLLPAR